MPKVERVQIADVIILQQEKYSLQAKLAEAQTTKGNLKVLSKPLKKGISALKYELAERPIL